MDEYEELKAELVGEFKRYLDDDDNFQNFINFFIEQIAKIIGDKHNE